jgi:hypothetical protein
MRRARAAGQARDSRTPAFWLAPLLATLPLLPFFSLRVSPLFLGKLAGDPADPFLRAGAGPWLAAAAVIFDGTLLAYFVAVPLYLLMKDSAKLRAFRVLAAFAVAGILASQMVHLLQDFRQPGLREFAVSWLSPLFGCLCGLVSGAAFLFLARRRFPAVARVLAYSLPPAMVVGCGWVLVWSSRAWRVR